MTKLVPVAAPSGTGNTPGVKGGPSREQVDRFQLNASIFELEARPKVRPGDVLPIFVNLKETRTGTATALISNMSLASATIGGKSAKKTRVKRSGLLNRMFGAPSIAEDSPRTIYVSGSNSRFGMFNSSMEASWRVDVPDDVPPGVHDVEVTLMQQSGEMNSGAGITTSFGGKLLGKPRTLRATIEVVPPDQPTLTLIEAEPEPTKKLERELTPIGNQLTVNDYGDRGRMGFGPRQLWVSGQVRIDSLSAPICHEVFMVLDEKEHSLGMLSSGRRSSGSDDPWASSFGATDKTVRTISGYVERVDVKTAKSVTLVLRPRVDHAEATLDMTSLYNGEITLKNVKVVVAEQYYKVRGSQTSDDTEGDEGSESESGSEANSEEN
jgi:hypothetical protein